MGSGEGSREGGFTRVRNRLIEALAVARFGGAEFRCLMFLLRKTYGWQKREASISLAQWALGTGVEVGKRHNVLRTLRGLVDKHVIYGRSSGTNCVMTWGFYEEVGEWDRSLFINRAVITEDNRNVITEDNRNVIAEDNKDVITDNNGAVITEDNIHNKRKGKEKGKEKFQEKSIAGEKEVTPQQLLYGEVCEALGWDHRTITDKDKVRVAQAVKILAAAGYTAADIQRFMVEVWFRDWRWLKFGQRPTLSQLRQEIGKLRALDVMPPDKDDREQGRVPFVKERMRDGEGSGAGEVDGRGDATRAGGGGSGAGFDAELQREFDEHRARRRSEGSLFYQ